jgi:hypothetical protein
MTLFEMLLLSESMLSQISWSSWNENWLSTVLLKSSAISVVSWPFNHRGCYFRIGEKCHALEIECNWWAVIHISPLDRFPHNRAAPQQWTSRITVSSYSFLTRWIVPSWLPGRISRSWAQGYSFSTFNSHLMLILSEFGILYLSIYRRWWLVYMKKSGNKREGPIK